MLVRYPSPDAVIIYKMAESEELLQSMLDDRKNIDTARHSPGGAGPSSQA